MYPFGCRVWPVIATIITRTSTGRVWLLARRVWLTFSAADIGGGGVDILGSIEDSKAYEGGNLGRTQVRCLVALALF